MTVQSPKPFTFQSWTTTKSPFLFLFLFVLLTVHIKLATCQIAFNDVTFESGLTQPKGASLKYGGATLSDLDGDGLLDLLLTNHNDVPAELYFNNKNTQDPTKFNFTRAETNWVVVDHHGLTGLQYSPDSKQQLIILTRGGANGNNLKPPLIFKVLPNRKLQDITSQTNIDPDGRSRLRVAVPIRLVARKVRPPPKSPDLLLTSVHMTSDAKHQRAFTLTGDDKFQKVNLNGGYEQARNEYAAVTDVQGDGVMELVAFQWLKMYKLTWGTDYKLVEITNSVFPPSITRGISPSGVTGVLEFDYDNDGKWDLFISRTAGQNLFWIPNSANTDDRLLRNVGGRYVDVSEEAGIPKGGLSRGATAADFDNDGWVDLIITRYDQDDILLRNLGNGKFAAPVVIGTINRKVVGDMASAADLDEDGRVDVVVSEGAWATSQATTWGNGRTAKGFYRLLKNIGNYGNNNWLLVDVGNSPQNGVTALHAVVRVVFGKGSNRRILWRRVTSPGVAVGISYVNVVHFGLGPGVNRLIDVRVRWTDRKLVIRRGVTTNQKIKIGA